ncbi:hypothetical protein GGR57DRAFT_453420 [Xylariaceae sp. FL1272]|nr:hypothetical protein GGR57DRAFT_453420 [Xylariaceae sp. FL1272]
MAWIFLGLEAGVASIVSSVRATSTFKYLFGAKGLVLLQWLEWCFIVLAVTIEILQRPFRWPLARRDLELKKGTPICATLRPPWPPVGTIHRYTVTVLAGNSHEATSATPQLELQNSTRRWSLIYLPPLRKHSHSSSSPSTPSRSTSSHIALGVLPSPIRSFDHSTLLVCVHRGFALLCC